MEGRKALSFPPPPKRPREEVRKVDGQRAALVGWRARTLVGTPALGAEAGREKWSSNLD